VASTATENSVNSFFKRIVESSHFNNISLLAILATAVVVGLETSTGIKNQYGLLLRGFEITLLIFFITESALRFLATGPKYSEFFKDGWNVFDLAIIVVCLLPINGHFAAVVRLARILRVLRVVRIFPRLRVIVGALLKGVSSMAYIAMLLSLLFYIYAVLGVFMFGAGDPQHFGSIPTAFLTLFQIVTLEGWVEVMRNQMSAGTNSMRAPLYFVSFIVIGTMIVLNLFIGTIVSSMSEAQEENAAESSPALPQPAQNSQNQLDSLLQEISALEQQVEKIRQRCASLRENLK